MKTMSMMALSLALVAGLAGCGKADDRAAQSDGSKAAVDDDGSTEIKHGKGAGTVVAVDAGNGKVTLDHGEIAELAWPPMTMGFAADPRLLADIKVGDKVTFEIDWNGKAGTVTRIAKAP